MCFMNDFVSAEIMNMKEFIKKISVCSLCMWFILVENDFFGYFDSLNFICQ